jgi:hypothetical protein
MVDKMDADEMLFLKWKNKELRDKLAELEEHRSLLQEHAQLRGELIDTREAIEEYTREYYRHCPPPPPTVILKVVEE